MTRNLFGATSLQLLNSGLVFLYGILMAYYFGTTSEMDAYVVVSTLLMLLGSLFTSFQTMGLIPHLGGIGEKEEQKNAFSIIFNFNNIIFFTATLFLFIFSPIVVKILAPGLDLPQKILAAKLMKVASAYLFLGNTASIFRAIMEFNLKPLRSLSYVLLQQFLLVIFLIAFHSYLGIYVLPISQIIAVLLVVPLYIIFMRKQDYSLKIQPLSALKSNHIRLYLQLLIPIVIGKVLIWGIKLSDTFLASYLDEGALSSISYCLKIVTNTSLLFNGIYVVYYPMLTRTSGKGKEKEQIGIFYEGFQLIFFLSLSFTLFLTIFSPEIIRILFERGSFTNQDTVQVASLLRGYSLMILCAPLGTHLSNIYYSRRAPKRATIYSIISSSVNIILNFILVVKFKALGLAVASSLAFLLGNILQASNIKKVNNEYRLSKMSGIILRSVIAVGIASGLSWGAKIVWDFNPSMTLGVLIRDLVIHGAFFIFTVFVLSYMTGVAPVVNTVIKLRKKLKT